MAKAAKTLCTRCDNRITVGDPFCDACGCPTDWATHDERTAWEVAQYRRKSAVQPIRAAVDTRPRAGAPRPAAAPAVSAPAARARRGIGGLFSRRSHAPQIIVPEAKRVEPPAPAPAVAEVAPEIGTAPALAVVRPDPVKAEPPKKKAPRPAAKPAPKVAPSSMDAEPLGDTPATVLALRLLNARVAELDEQLQRLQRAFDEVRSNPSRRTGS